MLSFDFMLSYKIEVSKSTEIIMILTDDIPIETKTNAIQERGIKNSASMVVKFDGNLINN